MVAISCLPRILRTISSPLESVPLAKTCITLMLTTARLSRSTKIVYTERFGVSTKFVEKITPAQCRAGRSLLDMTQSQLANAAKLGLSTVVDFERNRRQ